MTASNTVLSQADFVSLLFTTQKNGVKGESIGHGHTGHPQGFPVVVMRRQVAYLLRHSANRKMPLSSFKKASKWQQIRGDDITAAIRAVVLAAGPVIGFTEAGIRARSLRAGMAMALLMVRVYPYIIRLVGRLRSNTMLRYSEDFHRSSIGEDVPTWRLRAHYSGSCRQLVSRGTQGPSRPLLQGVYGGLVQYQCGLSDTNIAFLSHS